MANGSAHHELIEAAGIRGRLSIWADVLYDGPVPGGLDDRELLRVRARHLAGPVSGFVRRGTRGFRAGEMRSNVDSYDELVLWYEHDLVRSTESPPATELDEAPVAGLDHRELDRNRFLSGRPAFKGLGELAPKSSRRCLKNAARSAPNVRVGGSAPGRHSASRPPRHWTHCGIQDSALPFLDSALKRFLEEYPWTPDGLSRSERQLLHDCCGWAGRSHGPLFR